jgi:hypothetical protein
MVPQSSNGFHSLAPCKGSSHSATSRFPGRRAVLAHSSNVSSLPYVFLIKHQLLYLHLSAVITYLPKRTDEQRIKMTRRQISWTKVSEVDNGRKHTHHVVQQEKAAHKQSSHMDLGEMSNGEWHTCLIQHTNGNESALPTILTAFPLPITV